MESSLDERINGTWLWAIIVSAIKEQRGKITSHSGVKKTRSNTLQTGLSCLFVHVNGRDGIIKHGHPNPVDVIVVLVRP